MGVTLADKEGPGKAWRPVSAKGVPGSSHTHAELGSIVCSDGHLTPLWFQDRESGQGLWEEHTPSVLDTKQTQPSIG